MALRTSLCRLGQEPSRWLPEVGIRGRARLKLWHESASGQDVVTSRASGQDLGCSLRLCSCFVGFWGR